MFVELKFRLKTLKKNCNLSQLFCDDVLEAEYGELHSVDVYLASSGGDPDGAGHSRLQHASGE